MRNSKRGFLTECPSDTQLRGHFSCSADEDARAIQIAERTGNPVTFHRCHYYGIIRSMMTGAVDVAWESARLMLDRAGKAGSRRMLREAHQHLAVQACIQGKWDLCRNHAGKNLALRPGRGLSFTHISALTALVMAEFETGHFAAAKKHLRTLGSLSHSPEAPMPFAMARIAQITGDTRRLDSAEAVVRKVGLNNRAPFSWWQMGRWVTLSYIACLRNDLKTAAECAGSFLPRRGYNMVVNAAGKHADGVMALLCCTLDKFDESASCFEDALRSCYRAGCQPELAWTYYDFAEMLIRRDSPGDRERADTLLSKARDLTRTLGMRPLPARVENSLRRIRGSCRVTAVYPAGLTEREVEVLRLVTRGHTNREIGDKLFISPRTVARHMQNLFEKTGMANRAEATAFIIREGLAE